MKRRMKKLLSTLLACAMMIQAVPFSGMEVQAAGVAQEKTADPSTMDSWKEYFSVENSNISTENAGAVWTDKSVFKSYSQTMGVGHSNGTEKIEVKESDDEFLVALSAMASNETVQGASKTPTDTMLILDLSSSMYSNTTMDPATVRTMVNSVNTTIKDLQSLHEANRVGVTVYFGGGDYLQAGSSSSKVLMPLGRYAHSGNTFLTVTTSGGKLQSVKVNSNVYKDGKKVTVNANNTHTVAPISGTYAQLGILDAMNQFLAVNDNDVYVTMGNTRVDRIPVFIFMSDGKPTATTANYTKKVNADFGSNTEAYRNPNESDFLTQLTAAYAKEKVDKKYPSTVPLFYTLSLGSGISMDLMDPISQNNTTIAGYWDKLIKNGTLQLTVKNCKGQWDYTQVSKKLTVKKVAEITSKDQMGYVDKTFSAANANNLAAEFKKILSDISLRTKYFPTLVEGDQNLDGYVSFVDKIGKYMDVTSIEGLMIGGKIYTGACLASKMSRSELGTPESPTDLGNHFVWAVQERLGIKDVNVARTLIGQAYQYGQISYTNESVFSNYIGWYADKDGKYVGFWHEDSNSVPLTAKYIVKSYGYLGETDAAHHIAESDMMYAVVQVRKEIATNEELVTFAIPAALLPTVTYHIDLDENYKLEGLTRQNASPIRLLYKVALDPSINGYTINEVVDDEYLAANTDANGYVSFYSNQYDAELKTGYDKVNTYSYFRPSRQNGKYYYQDNELVYKDNKGTLYNGSSKPSENGTYYRAYEVFTKTGSKLSTTVKYYPLSSTALSTAKASGDGTWYIPKGNVHVNTKNLFNGMKADVGGNLTSTLPSYNEAFVDSNSHNVDDANHRFVIGATLGNNGYLKLKPQTGLMISKMVEEWYQNDTADTKSFTVTVTRGGDISAAEEYDTVIVNAKGQTSTGKLSFAAGNAEAAVTLTHGEKVYIVGMPAGETFTIKENFEDNYILSDFEIDDADVNGDSADVTVTADKVKKVEFTNTVRGVGNVTISKYVNHSADGYAVPNDVEFELEIKLSLNEKPLVGSYNVKKYDASEADPANQITQSTITTDTNGVVTDTITLANNDQLEIFDLPEKTVVDVKEILTTGQAANYNVSYEVNGKEKSPDSTSGYVHIEVQKTIKESLEVLNEYTPLPVYANLEVKGTKFYYADNGATEIANWGTQKFSFKLQQYDSDDQDWKDVGAEKEVNQDHREFTFDTNTIQYTKPGTYFYRVFEVIPGTPIEKLYYDQTYHTFHVAVEDNGGQLAVKEVVSDHQGKNPPYYNESTKTWCVTTDFTNISYDSVPVNAQININKLLTGSINSPNAGLDGFEFEIYDANDNIVTSATDGILSIDKSKTDVTGTAKIDITFETSGTYKFYIQEKAGNQPGMNYNTTDKIEVVIEVAVDSNQQLSVTSITYPDQKNAVEITNEYKPTPATITLDVTKELTGRELENGEFSFVLEKLNGTNWETVKTGSNQSTDNDKQSDEVLFENGNTLTFTDVGTHHYRVRETTEDGDGVTVDKSIYNIYITVTDNNGALVAVTSVAEIVGDNIVFQNTYKAEPCEAVIRGEKTLNGRDLLAGEFIFELYEEDGTTLLQSVTNIITDDSTNTDRLFAFEALPFDSIGTYKYVVKEKIPENAIEKNGEYWMNGIQYDGSIYDVTITVEDDKEGKLVPTVEYSVSGDDKGKMEFVNVYDAEDVEVTIQGAKELTGRDANDNEFTFELYEADENGNIVGTAPVRSAKNTAGTFSFEKFTYSEAGSYIYAVKEVVDTSNGDIVYDESVYYVEVDVVDHTGKGVMEATVTYYTNTGAVIDKVTFVNAAVVEDDDKVTIEGTKKLTGRELKKGAFTFELYDKDTGKRVKSVKNDKDGKFAFELKYDKDDAGITYNYVIKEKIGKVDGMTYDAHEYNVRVSVEADNAGVITTKVTWLDADDIVFNNSYEEPENPKKPEDDDDDEPTTPPTPTKVESADSGDDTNLFLPIAMLIAALAGIAGWLFMRKREED